jgi:hypothetical protein
MSYVFNSPAFIRNANGADYQYFYGKWKLFGFDKFGNGFCHVHWTQYGADRELARLKAAGYNVGVVQVAWAFCGACWL